MMKCLQTFFALWWLSHAKCMSMSMTIFICKQLTSFSHEPSVSGNWTRLSVLPSSNHHVEHCLLSGSSPWPSTELKLGKTIHGGTLYGLLSKRTSHQSVPLRKVKTYPCREVKTYSCYRSKRTTMFPYKLTFY